MKRVCRGIGFVLLALTTFHVLLRLAFPRGSQRASTVVRWLNKRVLNPVMLRYAGRTVRPGPPAAHARFEAAGAGVAVEVWSPRRRQAAGGRPPALAGTQARGPVRSRGRSRAATLLVTALVAASCSTSAPLPGPSSTEPSTASSTVTTSTTAASTTTAAITTTTGAPTTTAASTPAGAVVIDHTTTDAGLIPPEWVAAAKDVEWAYGSTSHGTQVWVGAQNLADHDPGLPFAADWRYLPMGEELSMAYDDGWSWDPSGFVGQARALLADVPEATAFMWSWCGELSDGSTDVQAYLDGMAVLRDEYPGVAFVYMTGHTDGGSPELDGANDRIRAAARDTGGVLFDFADIERFDPAGVEYPGTDDSCPWCEEWCAGHPDYCAGLGDMDCAHSHPLMCRLKAGALWWLSARLAGWDGEEVAAP